MDLGTATSFAVPLVAMATVYVVLLRGGSGFRYRAAQLQVRTARGPLMAVWLTLVAAAWTLIEIAATTTNLGGDTSWTASVVVTAIGVVVAALVLAQRTTLFLLALLGLTAQFTGIAQTHGPGAAAAVLIVTLPITWLYGLARGLQPLQSAPTTKRSTP